MENIEEYRKAGKIAGQARDYARTIIRPGAKLLDVAEKVEAKIVELGGQPAFPVNLSLNQFAAHCTPVPNDEAVFSDQVVKVDVGAQIDGFIGDTACTIDLSGKYADLVKASEQALNAAIDAVRQNRSIGEIGRQIQDAITGFGFAPIKNLGGHGLQQYVQHAAPSIPNHDTGNPKKLEKEQVIAIEPFATTGQGMVKDSSNSMIFAQVDMRPVRDNFTRQVLGEIAEFNAMPFCTRWLAAKFPINQLRFALSRLVQAGILREYPPLPEMANGIVSQAEHTLYIGDEIEILTR